MNVDGVYVGGVYIMWMVYISVYDNVDEVYM